MPFGIGSNPCGEMEYWPMAGLAAGVVTQGDVETFPSAPSRLSMSLQNPATWTYIWVALAFLYLFGIYVGMIRFTRR